MKNMLIAAVSLGAVAASLILYLDKKNKSQSRIKDAANNAYDSMNGAIGRLERPAYHAMG